MAANPKATRSQDAPVSERHLFCNACGDKICDEFGKITTKWVTEARDPPAVKTPTVPDGRYLPDHDVGSQVRQERRRKYTNDRRALHEELDFALEFAFARENERYAIDLLKMIEGYLKGVNMMAWEQSSGLFDLYDKHSREKAEVFRKQYSDENGKFADPKEAGPTKAKMVFEVCQMHRHNSARGACLCEKMASKIHNPNLHMPSTSPQVTYPQTDHQVPPTARHSAPKSPPMPRPKQKQAPLGPPRPPQLNASQGVPNPSPTIAPRIQQHSPPKPSASPQVRESPSVHTISPTMGLGMSNQNQYVQSPRAQIQHPLEVISKSPAMMMPPPFSPHHGVRHAKALRASPRQDPGMSPQVPYQGLEQQRMPSVAAVMPSQRKKPATANTAMQGPKGVTNAPAQNASGHGPITRPVYASPSPAPDAIGNRKKRMFVDLSGQSSSSSSSGGPSQKKVRRNPPPSNAATMQNTQLDTGLMGSFPSASPWMMTPNTPYSDLNSLYASDNSSLLMPNSYVPITPIPATTTYTFGEPALSDMPLTVETTDGVIVQVPNAVMTPDGMVKRTDNGAVTSYDNFIMLFDARRKKEGKTTHRTEW